VPLGHHCPRVKRDGTAGLVGCWIRRPPKAAPPSRRVRPPATVGGREGTRLRRALLRWQAPQPCRSRPGATVVGPSTPTLDPTRISTLVPTPATRVPLASPEAPFTLVMAPRGSGAAAPGGALRASDSLARPRLWPAFGRRRLRRQSQPALVARQGGIAGAARSSGDRRRWWSDRPGLGLRVVDGSACTETL
jgi:hypothetical protein